MIGRARRLGLQAWLGLAFVVLGAVASLIAIVVVLPNLEDPIRREESTKAEDYARLFLQRLAVETRSEDEIVSAGNYLVDIEDGDVRITEITADSSREVLRRVTHGYLPAGLAELPLEVPQSVGEAVAQTRRTQNGDAVAAVVKARMGEGTPESDATVVIELGLPVEGTASRLGIIRQRIFISTALVLSLALVLGLLTSRLLGSRMRRLADTAAHLARGDLSARAEVHSPVEVASLANSLNTMAAQLEGLVDETVTDRDRAEGLVASLTEGVLAVSDRGEVTVANPAARRLLSLPDEHVGVTLDDLPDSVRRAWNEARDGMEHTSVVEAEFGGGKEVLLQGSRLSREAGVVLTMRDVTEERRLNRARRDLIANVSHELKTPLTAVKGLLELLESERLDAERRREFLDLMGQEVERLERLIAEQLELARIDAGAMPLELAAHDLAAIAHDVASSRRHLADRAGLQLVSSVPPKPVVVDVDPARIEQILLILLDNAFKHTPTGGKITVGVGVEENAATMTVRDTGQGIPPEAQPFVFDRFYRADESREGRGLGLGLSIARGLAEAHGGSVDLRSTPGVGSVFIVRLPLSRARSGVGVAT